MSKCKHEHGFYILTDAEGEITNAECVDCALDVR